MNFYRLKNYKESIFLVGFMATGKSSIGKLIAGKLERPFVDLDEVIEEKEGKSIKHIFEQNGEAYFREKEWDALLELTQNFKGVVSLGGGAIHNQQVLDHLKLFGLLVFLKTPMDVIISRILRNKKRPIVLDQNGEIKSQETLKTELNDLYLSREGLYTQAQIIIESTGSESKEEQVSAIIEKLQRYV